MYNNKNDNGISVIKNHPRRFHNDASKTNSRKRNIWKCIAAKKICIIFSQLTQSIRNSEDVTSISHKQTLSQSSKLLK